MSRIVTGGKAVPYGRPVDRRSIEGLLDPRTAEHIGAENEKLVVDRFIGTDRYSTIRFTVREEWMPAQWWSPLEGMADQDGIVAGGVGTAVRFVTQGEARMSAHNRSCVARSK
jgi:hypothetical protein